MSEENIVLPKNEGLKDAYVALIKSMYLEHQEDFWLTEILTMISTECGVTIETAKDRCKQLVRFGLVKYLYSSLGGHRYIVLAYSKQDDDVRYVDDWGRFNRLIENQFDNLVETDLMKISKSMNSLGGTNPLSELREQREVGTVFKNLEESAPIKPGADTIKSEFKTTIQESRSEAAAVFEKALRDSSGNEPTKENSVISSE